MAIDKDTQVSASVILDKTVYEEFKILAKKHKRSASAQIAFLIDEFIKAENEKES